jgi:hypothetical protein
MPLALVRRLFFALLFEYLIARQRGAVLTHRHLPQCLWYSPMAVRPIEDYSSLP